MSLASPALAAFFYFRSEPASGIKYGSRTAFFFQNQYPELKADFCRAASP